MIDLNECIELGYISKTHGIKGELVLRLNDVSFDDIENMELVFVLFDGLPVPFFIDEFTERNIGSLLIKFEDINSETEAKVLVDKSLYLPLEYLSKNTIPILKSTEALLGYAVVDIHNGEIGLLNLVIKHSENPLMLVTNGKNEIYIPLQEEFILEINEKEKTILVDCPEGLISVNS
jgi:16S rRNA processing protein RimM